jgi:hypothetical protein
MYDFDVGPQFDRLNLGGVQMYPPVFGEPAPIYVRQFPSEYIRDYLEAHPRRPRLQITQMEFFFNDAETISENGNELLTMHLKVMAIADKSISPHLIDIRVLKDVNGRMRILSTKSIVDPAEIAVEEAEQCATWPMVCKLRKFLADKLATISQAMKKPGKGGCHKSKGNPAADRVDMRPHHRPGRPGKPHHRPHHPHHDHHGHHRHHHSKLHRLLHIFVRVVVTFVVPILIGIAAGVATYMAGMLIGMLVAFVWLKIRGVRPGQYESVMQEDDDEAGEDLDPSIAKQVYYDEPVEVEGEAPPVYQEKEVVN